MRVLCAIGIRRGSELVKRLSKILRGGDELTLAHVLDEGPRHDLNHLEGTLRPHHLRQGELDSAEEEAGRTVLAEAAEVAGSLGFSVTTRLERGNPEHVIVELSRELEADVIAVFARETPGRHPLHGPPSVGHTARFVVDHAAADVLIFREER